MRTIRVLTFLMVCIIANWIFAACTPQDTTIFPENDNFRHIGSFDVSYPAFLYDDKARATDPDENLLLTSFWPTNYVDHVSSISNLESTVNYLIGASPTRATPVLETLVERLEDNPAFWPNEAQREKTGIFGAGDYLTIAHGFLLGYLTQDGAISLLNVDTGETQRLSQDILDYPNPGDTNTWFYHHVKWHDMNNDGRKDIVTARAHWGTKEGRLVWLEQPVDNPGGQRWAEHLIGEGPDVGLILHDIDGDGQVEIIATELMNARLSVWWKTDPDPTAEWTGRVVDPALGAGFGLSVVDLNNDGIDDLLVTNHTNSNDPPDPPFVPASVFAYEFPQGPGAYQTDDWTRHVLLTDIETIKPGAGQASPGRAKAFHPDLNNTSGKKWIHVDGDGAQNTYVLIPDSEDTGDWNYTAHITLILEDSITGQSEIKDVNNDGYNDLFIPAFEHGKIYIFTFAP